MFKTCPRMAVRLLAGVRVAWGLALLADPQAVLWRLTGERADPRASAFARMLGTRHVLQAALACRYDSRSSMVAGASVDTMHAMSMAVVAARSSGYRRRALVSTAAATTFAVAGLALCAAVHPPRAGVAAE